MNRVYTHCEAFGVMLPGLVQPFFDPPQEQGICTSLVHDLAQSVMGSSHHRHFKAFTTTEYAGRKSIHCDIFLWFESHRT
jgi:hypothetical protein